jgi:hypothetical protein
MKPNLQRGISVPSFLSILILSTGLYEEATESQAGFAHFKVARTSKEATGTGKYGTMPTFYDKMTKG